MNGRLSRITDLFQQGAVAFLGDDETGNPVCVWLEKSNSFQVDEARNDGLTGRVTHLLSLDDPENMLMVDVKNQVESWSDEELTDVLVNQKYEEHYAGGITDVEADKDWTEKLEYLRRAPEIMEDGKIEEDDPRRKQYQDANLEYIKAVNLAIEKRQKEFREDLANMDRAEMVDTFLKDYKDKSALEAYMTEKRVTELFYAMRVCDAARTTEPGTWDHAKCNHRQFLLEKRSEVRDLPEHVVMECVKALDEAQMGARQVANFPVAQSG